MMNPISTESTLRSDLESLLNRHSQENASNTPDFLLAEYLLDCLRAFNKVANAREAWYGRPSTPPGNGGMIVPDEAGPSTPINQGSVTVASLRLGHGSFG